MRKLFVIFVVMFVVVGGWFVWHSQQSDKPQQTANSNQQAASFDKHQRSLQDPSSLWIIVNKQRPLNPKTYAPNDLVAPSIPLRLAATSPEMQMRRDAATALEKLVGGAKKDGLNLMVSSAYRSYDYQVSLYNHYVATQGKSVADTQSARPGHSEHQTGLAVDVEPASRKCEVEDCFADLPEGKWVAANAYRYGFVVRYQQGSQSVTGYIYEPWHLRYVGIELSQELHRQNNPTLEAFFGLPAAPDYQ